MLAYGHVWIMIEALLKVEKLIFTHPHIISYSLLLVDLINVTKHENPARSFRTTLPFDVKNKTRNTLKQTLIRSNLLVYAGQKTNSHHSSQ